jgi:acetylornithine deacetylase
VTGYESEVAGRLAEWLRLPGVKVSNWSEKMADLERDPEYPGREVEREWAHVVTAEVTGSAPGPTVVLTGHIDTVGPGDKEAWRTNPFEAAVVDDRVYGLGACDMKGGLVAAIEAFELLAGEPREFSGTVRFVAVSGEEDGGTGTLAAIRRGCSGNYVILTEPTSGANGPDIVVAHAGALTFTVTVEGRSGHGSMPETGESALEHFWTVYRAMQRLSAAFNAAESHNLMTALGTPYATNVGKIQGGSWASNVMESITAEMRVGVALNETIATAEQRFATSLLGAVAADPWLSTHPPRIARTGAAFGSSAIDPDHPLVTTVAAAAEKVTGKRPALTARPYGCDMALWTRVGGAATLVYGPGDLTAAHAPDEWISLTEIATTAQVLQEAARRLLPRHSS